ncbi:MAG: hypothetical protein ACREMQ_13870 [Longimicrobiales bacterium]
MSIIAICGLTFFGCLVSSVLPIVNAELLLLSMAAIAAPDLAVPLIVLATLGQMIGKTLLFLAGRGAVHLPGRWGEKVEDVRARLGSGHRIGGSVLFVSAAVGLPPFFVVSLASGIIGMGLRQFLGLGLSGRLLRFGAIVLFPQIVKGAFA